ncbi:MAG: S9 family peptidase [Gammaproteobacteria bacterium]|nr:S9 family peptidase [Gammaproteobacteria bacterium]|tara:strand:+ start:77 stop:2161 length:2085 start_codon:yes stop_codon:yes gene_type:complete
MTQRLLAKTQTFALAAAMSFGMLAQTQTQADDFMWLEEVEGEAALAWVEEQNARSLPQIQSHPSYQQLYENSLEVLNSDARIPGFSRRGDYLYNLWRDAEHVRGLYRRTTLAEYRTDAPRWETVLDLDKLAADEGENWTWGGINCLYPDYDRCLLSLSIAGSDAAVVREFSIADKSFVDGGFVLPEAKSRVNWLDENTVIVGTDTGAGSMTDSGYPAQLRVWQRGQAIETATPLYSTPADSVSVYSFTLRDGENAYPVINESLTFYTSDRYVFRGGDLTLLPIPNDAGIAGLFRNNLYIDLKSDWQGFPQGAVVYAPMDDVLAGEAQFRLFVHPDERSAILDVQMTADAILVNWLDNVRGRLDRYTPQANGDWQRETVAFDPNGSISIQNASHLNNDFFVSYNSFLEPTTLYHVDNDLATTAIKQLPAMFDASPFETRQYMATSADGTQIPYFVVMARDARLDGSHPTQLYAYGGFEISYRPTYSASIGRNWLHQGGVYVLANIRGGGEFGPRWHQAALLKNRHKAYEDFEAVAEDLIARGITSPEHLGIRGGSNGGLLVGAAVTRRPDLYNAVVSQVPLLDMQRYNKLLAGASWMGEYGNPDEEDMWAYIRSYSPYHNVHEGVDYPKIFFTTSTRDDRVHPAHARKMVAKMTDMGHDVLYYENTEGGHSGAANNEQRAQLDALIYAYLLERLQ